MKTKLEDEANFYEDLIAPPSRYLLARESLSVLEIPALLSAAPFLATAPRGDGHAVVVLPGFGADDESTVAIRRFLDYLGYDVHGWNRGPNIRPPYVDLPDIAEQVLRLWRLHDAPVSLVGWSRGGILAREVARENPRAVRCVISLASPFAAPGASNMGPLMRLLTGRRHQLPSPQLARRIARPIPVPSTSIYTRWDGVVAWRGCLDPEGPRRENVEVRSTHSGIGLHPPALWVIADRLAQEKNTWRAFKPSPLVAAFFPSSWPWLRVPAGSNV